MRWNYSCCGHCIIKIKTTLRINVTKYCHSEKLRYIFDWYILHTVLLAIILVLIITIICYYYAKEKGISPFDASVLVALLR